MEKSDIVSPGTWIVMTNDYAAYCKKGDVVRTNLNECKIYGSAGSCVNVSDYVGNASMPFKSYIRLAEPHEIPNNIKQTEQHYEIY